MEQTPTQAPRYWWRPATDVTVARCAAPRRPGDLCPHCQHGQMVYDSFFRLVCSQCGYSPDRGGFT